MNIFFVEALPQEAAKALCDKHNVKMILESCQMLVTGLREHDIPLDCDWKSTHVNHPMTRWVVESRPNFQWLTLHAKALAQEYTFRYNKRHKCEDLIDNIMRTDLTNYPDQGFTDIPLCMPDDYKTVEFHNPVPTEPEDMETYQPVEYHVLERVPLYRAVSFYRMYYHSKEFAQWNKNRPAPDWWLGVEVTA